ncbi:MAG: DUF2235 domain-containing protein [Ginsengibacter sp.]
MKKIVVCCDGTWSKPGNIDQGVVVETNVEKIYKAITSGSIECLQMKFYGQGVGTGFSIQDHLFGGSFGKGLDTNIQDAYKFIMWNYKQGDELYLFGFSRGAYTVRSLAGLIRNCGIMKPEYLHLVMEAYHLYRDRTELTHPDSDMMKSFKTFYGIENETEIKFIGVWDTVGALGIPVSLFNWYNIRYEFHDIKLSSYVKYAYHALAVDEKRKLFKPALWEVKENTANREQVCEQVWFPGVHCNVGGGYADSGLSNLTLLWMIEKAQNTGLLFDEATLKAIKAESCAEIRNSIRGVFKFTPKQLRAINKGIIKKKDVSGKLIDVKAITNESLHYSCVERYFKIKGYKPKNLYLAYQQPTPFNPLKDQWKEEWIEFLKALDIK